MRGYVELRLAPAAGKTVLTAQRHAYWGVHVKVTQVYTAQGQRGPNGTST